MNNPLSYFTRLNYNYNDKYMLMFTFRADGSSKYNDKWGYFPSLGAAWVISQEPFMKNQNIFDYMKLVFFPFGRISMILRGQALLQAPQAVHFSSSTSGRPVSGFM